MLGEQRKSNTHNPSRKRRYDESYFGRHQQDIVFADIVRYVNRLRSEKIDITLKRSTRHRFQFLVTLQLNVAIQIHDFSCLLALLSKE